MLKWNKSSNKKLKYTDNSILFGSEYSIGQYQDMNIEDFEYSIPFFKLYFWK